MRRGADRLSQKPSQQRGPSRQERKAELEALVDQQRLELMVYAARWRRSVAPMDRAFHRLWQWRTPLLAVGSLALIPVARRPGSVLRFGRKLVFGALAVDRVRRMLPGQRGR